MIYKPAKLTIFFHLFTITLLYPQPFVHYQTLNDTEQNINCIEISDDNQILAMGSYGGNIKIFKQNEGDFLWRQTLADGKKTFDIDMTDDGKWLMGAFQNNNAQVYKYNQTKEQFEYFQSLNNDSSGQDSKVALISNDHTLAAYAVKQKLYVYEFKGQEFTLIQILSVSNNSRVTDAKFSNDNSYLYFPSKAYQIYIYKIEENELLENKILQSDYYGSKKIFLSKNDLFLVISQTQSKKINIYEYNYTSKEYQLSEQNGLLSLDQQVEYSSISSNFKWMGISGLEEVEIYIFLPDQNMTQIQTIEGESYVLTFSKDSRILIAHSNQKVKIFKLNCSESQFYDINERECKECLIRDCSVCINENHCDLCQEGFAKSNETKCLVISSQNQTNQKNQTVQENQTIKLQCDKNMNLFLQNGECIKCNIQKCQKCTNLEKCQECSSHYIIEDGKCKKHEEISIFMILMISFVGLFTIIYIFCLRRIKNQNQKEVQIESAQVMKNDRL